jgi:ABC-2 type transport system ATP-binding protein
MSSVIAFDHVTKRYRDRVALADVSFTLAASSIVALVGRNGSGKTTLLHHVAGLRLPTTGRCTTLGTPTPQLGSDELERIGLVYQQQRVSTWMSVQQLIRYVASFYRRWDPTLESALTEMLDIDLSARVQALSTGATQKLAILLGSCHRPTLLLLDEPLSTLDSESRAAVLRTLIERVCQDETTVVISSHLLHDLEIVADRVLALESGRLVADASLDDLRERFAEWTITSVTGALPLQWAEQFVRAAEGDQFRARLIVEDPEQHRAAFGTRYDVALESRPLSLERIVALLAGRPAGADSGAAPLAAQPR